jgi:nucleoside-diphosphate-sugar epimerase
MHILITGALGGIGKHVTAHLAALGHRVRAIDLAPQSAAAALAVEYHACDITDYNALRPHLEGAEAVLHLAAIISPCHGLPQDVFHVNVTGTFNVYQAAAEAGVRRVINTSSINTLGYNFGIKPVPLHYFPVDEDHPALATDPYSFSKQVGEQIADYFFRRDGITGFSLRLCGVYDQNSFPPQALVAFSLGLRRELQALLERPEAERLAIAREALRLYDETRPERSHPGALFDLVRRTLALAQRSPAAAAAGYNYGGQGDLWTTIDIRDVVQAFEKALLADAPDHQPLFINDSHNLAGIQTEQLLGLFFPQVTRRTRPIPGTQSVVSIDRARALIGFEPQYSVSRYF